MNYHRYRHRASRPIRGFTLIELMIVLAIVAILAALAYPSYRNSVLKGRRSDATIATTKLAQRLERCHTQFGRYSDPGCSVQNGATVQSDNGYYSVGVAIDGANNSYTLTATPTSKGAQDEDACTQYQLFSTGERTANNDDISDAAKARETCW